jgi:replicative DNA helicase
MTRLAQHATQKQTTPEYIAPDVSEEENPQEDEVYQDVTIEWRILNKLLIAEYKDYINRLTPRIFTGIRTDVFRAIQLAYIDDGAVTFEGIDYHMNGNVPGELLAASAGDFHALLKQAIRIARKRQLRTRARLMDSLSKEYNPSEEKIDRILELDPILAEEDSSLVEGVQEFLGSLHAKASGEYIFRKTGFKMLDRTLGGEYRPNSLMVLLGGPGSGKTAFWQQSQLAMAKGYINEKTGEQIITPSLFISLEMTKSDLLLRLVANELSVNNTDISSANFDQIVYDSNGRFESKEHVISAIEEKLAELQQLSMYIIDNEELSLAQIIYQIRRHVHKFGVRVIGIDYLQLINHTPTGNANHDLGEVAQELKALAKRERITIVLLSQINRTKEGMDAIRDSGEIQAVASVIMQLTPEEDDGLAAATPYKAISGGFWKNRHGRSGHKVPMLFHGPYQRFEESV